MKQKPDSQDSLWMGWLLIGGYGWGRLAVVGWQRLRVELREARKTVLITEKQRAEWLGTC